MCVVPSLCLTVTAQQTVQRFDTNADGTPDQWERFKGGSDEPYKVESGTDGAVGFRVGNVEPIREEKWPTSRSTISR